jgi:hypothetical protein
MKSQQQKNSTTIEKDTNVTTANKLENVIMTNKSKYFYQKNTSYHATPFPSHTIKKGSNIW